MFQGADEKCLYPEKELKIIERLSLRPSCADKVHRLHLRDGCIVVFREHQQVGKRWGR